MAIRRRSSSPLRAGWRQGRSASGSCRSTSDPDAACPRCTTGLENAHGTVVREVLYRWHPWFGLAVHVHAAATKSDGVHFRCTLNGADGARWQELPAWMFDRAACAGPGMLVAEPFVSMAALSALSRLLDAVGRPSPSSPRPPGLGAAYSRLDRNRGEDHADATSVTITPLPITRKRPATTARPRQIDLFAGDPGKTAPTWRELPEEARVLLTNLMARLILDHARLDGAAPSKEVGDDL